MESEVLDAGELREVKRDYEAFGRYTECDECGLSVLKIKAVAVDGHVYCPLCADEVEVIDAES